MGSHDTLETAPEGLVTIDQDGIIVELNAAAEQMFGHPRESAIGESLDLIIPPELRHAATAGIQRVAGGGTPRIMDQRRQFEALRSDGSRFPIELLVSRTANDPQLFTGWVRDLTRQGPASSENRREGLLAARAEEAASMGSWELDLVTGEMAWSDNFFRLLGLEVGEVGPSRERFLEYVHLDDLESVETVTNQLDEAREVPSEYRIVLADGEVRHMDATVKVVGRDGDKVTRVIGAVHDVTEMREAEREVAAHRAVVDGLRGWKTLQESGPALLARLARPFDATVGAIWIPRGDVLRCYVVWPSRTLKKLEMVELNLEVRLPRGSGLPGLAWSRGEPVSASSISDFDHDRARVAAETGLSSGVAFPVIHSGETMMIVELLTSEQIELTESLSLSLIAIGHQICQFMYRRRGELGPLLLTPRELQILQCAAEGLSGPNIAEKLTISPATVKTHFENIYAKLEVSDRAAAVAEALRLGLFE